MVSIDQEIEVQILHIDHEKEKIALGLKQRTPSPWETVDQKFPVGSRIKGTVVNVMSYGAFVKLEEGIGGPRPHQRNVVDPADQPSQRTGSARAGNRSRRARPSTKRSRKSRWA